MSRSFFMRPFAVAALATSAVSMPASATDYYLGTIAAPTSVPIASSGLFGSFVDHFSFTVAAGETIDFSSSFETGYWKIAYITGFAASLKRGADTVATGALSVDTLPEGWPDLVMTFASQPLTSGEYVLEVSGVEHPAYENSIIWMSYAGQVDFAPSNTSVPEPAAPATWMLGLAMLAASVPRRKS